MAVDRKNKKILNRPFTTEEFKEFTNAARDPFFFSRFIYLIHPLRGKVRFNLYPFQKSVLWCFLTKRFNIILKFRQAGVTELISMYCLWLAMYHPYKNIVIVSIKERVAKKVLRKIKFMYRNLPDHLKVEVDNGKGDDLGTSTELSFSNGSLITSIPTTEEAGRSEAVSLLVVDEAAIVRWANQIWAAAYPTLSTGGAAIINSCVTGDTEIIGKDNNFRIDSICPKKFGKRDISHLGLKVLSHTGKWQNVIGAVNKGLLETWEIKDVKGNILKCTPHHKLYTSKGWRTVKDIIKGDEFVITYDTGIGKLQNPPITISPTKEILKPIMNFPNYMVSNLGKIYIRKNGRLIEKESRVNKRGYLSLKLWHKNSSKKFMVANLVATHFIGKIPKGYIVDHINCDPLKNYITNLQIITVKENAQRATLYSRGLRLGTMIGKGFANIKLIAQIREDNVKGLGVKELALKYNVNMSYISRTLNNRRVKAVQISKITLIRKYLDNIYDICVENDESYITTSNYVNHNTPYGVGNWFHQMWVSAFAGGNEFNPIRLRWQMHPERDIDWYKSMASSLGPRRTAQEIDGDFLTSGNSVFDLVDIRSIEEELLDYKPYKISMNGSLIQNQAPVKDEKYYIGCDVATGRSRDYSTFTILDRFGDEYACFKKKIAVGPFADLLMKIGKEYNYATIAPESNDIGLAVTTKIQESGYRHLYYTKQMLRKKGESKPIENEVPGWITTNKNRPVILAGLEEDIRNGDLITKDPFFVHEAYTFIYDETNRPVAMGKGKRATNEDEDVLATEGFTDDAIMGKAITNHIRKGKKVGPIILPR